MSIGDVNPAEIPIVIEEDGKLLVVEGNRRLAALKLLANPDLAADNRYREAFRDLARQGSGPSEILCVLMESRDATDHWLELRHTGENEGRGVVQWNSLQSNNFRRRPGSHADRAALFCDAVKKDFPGDVNFLSSVDEVRRARLTTLGRLVSDPDVRHSLGFDFEGDRVVFFFPPLDMVPLLTELFSDFEQSLGVSDIKSKEQRIEYVKSLSELVPPPSARLLGPRVAGTTPVPSGSIVTPVGGRATTRRRTPTQDRVIFQGLKLSHVNLRTSKLLEQAQKADIDSAPRVAAVMVRVIVELVVTEVGLRLSPPVDEQEKLKKKIRRVLLTVDPDCENPTRRNKDLEMAWIRSQDHNGLGVQSLHAFVHNYLADPTAQDVRTLSGTFRELLKLLDDYLGGLSTP